jgi:hypothetical protein
VGCGYSFPFRVVGQQYLLTFRSACEASNNSGVRVFSSLVLGSGCDRGRALVRTKGKAMRRLLSQSAVVGVALLLLRFETQLLFERASHSRTAERYASLYTRAMDELVKIVVFVPVSHADTVREAMGQAGAGQIGKYSYCSFTTKGLGRFLPEAGATPAVGEVGQLEHVEEERIEVACKKEHLSEIIQAIKAVHPYADR